jgi:hypothetical protein
MLSELRGTPLHEGDQWDAEARARLADFQRSEGMPPTGEPDDATVARLVKRFEGVVAARRAEPGAPIVTASPTAAAHKRVAHSLQEAMHAAEHVAEQFAHDSPIRAQYMQEARAFSQKVLQDFERGVLSEGEAAFLASQFGNNALKDARSGLSPAGSALSKFLKEEGTTLPVLMEKYALKSFGNR